MLSIRYKFTCIRFSRVPYKILVAFLLLGVAVPVVTNEEVRAEYFFSKIHEGSASDKMTIIWIPSGFRQDRKNMFFDKVGRTTNAMWNVNWFKDHKHLFDVYRIEGDDGTEPVPVWDEDGLRKSVQEVKKLISALPNDWGSCDFLKDVLCKTFPSVVIDEHNLVGGAANGHFYIGLNASAYEYPHEWSHDGFAKVLCDEYESGPGASGAHWCRNLDDVDSNRKWNEFVTTPPFEGGNHRSTGIFRPTKDSILRSLDTSPVFDPIGYEAMNKALDKKYGRTEIQQPNISCSIKPGDVVTGDVTVSCYAVDNAGIEMVVFYCAKDGELHQSFGLDRTPPYEATLKASQMEDGKYWLRAVAWDKNWNFRQYNPSFRISSTQSPPPVAETPLDPPNIPVGTFDIPLEIRDVSGVNRTKEVVSSGVPLPKGTLGEPASIAVYAPDGSVVPAQFKVLERWRDHGQDNSVKWLLVTFLADVPANSAVTYRLKNGSNPKPANPVSVADTGTAFQMAGKTFPKNFSGEFDLVFTKPDGTQVHASDLSTIKWEVMENGPVRTMLKAESATERSADPTRDKFGFIAYIYGYSGLGRWDMTVVLKNTPQTENFEKSYGPMLFKDFSVVWKQNGSNYAIGGDSGQSVQNALNSGQTIHLYQDSSGTEKWNKLGEYGDGKGAYVQAGDELWKLGIPEFRGYTVSDGAKELSRGYHALGWARIDNAGIGVRHFWQQFPKAVEVQPGKLIVRLWPKYWKGHGGVHWLDDAQRKDHDITFRSGGFTENDAQAFNNPLVIHCGLDWYRKTGAMGYISKDARSAEPNPGNIGSWEYGWVNWGGNYNDRYRRRYHEYPVDGFIKTSDPYHAYQTRIAMRHSSSMTPVWIDDYAYPRDEGELRMRCYCCAFRARGQYPQNMRFHGYQPWNKEHWTISEVFDGWRIFGDPLAYDAIQKIGEYLQFWSDYRKTNGIGETRVDSLAQNVFAETYRITGNSAIKSSLAKYFGTIWKTVNKERGYYVPNKNVAAYPNGVEKTFMLGYLAEGLEETYGVLGDERIVDMITGIADFAIDEAYVSPCYAVLYESPIPLTEVETARKKALASSTTACDCSSYASGSREYSDCKEYREWRILSLLELAYRYTGKSRYKDMFSTVYENGVKKTGGRNFHTWNSALSEMVEAPRTDTMSPSAIGDLKAVASGAGQATLTWTAPKDARRYQVKFADYPLVENRTSVASAPVKVAPDQCNWWAANNAAGEPVPSGVGAQEKMVLDGLGAGTYYFAVRSYDESSNIAPISNVVRIEVTSGATSIVGPRNVKILQP